MNANVTPGLLLVRPYKITISVDATGKAKYECSDPVVASDPLQVIELLVQTVSQLLPLERNMQKQRENAAFHTGRDHERIAQGKTNPRFDG